MGVVDLNKVRSRPTAVMPPPHFARLRHKGPIYPAQPSRLAGVSSLPHAPHQRGLLPRTHPGQEASDEPRAARGTRHEGGRAASRPEAVERAAQGVPEDWAAGVSRDEGARPRVGQGGHDGADPLAADQNRRHPAQAVHECLGTEERTPK